MTSWTPPVPDPAEAHIPSAGQSDNVRMVFDAPPPSWPWVRRWWKPTDRRRDLVKAGALILAEIERLDRIEREAMVNGNSRRIQSST